MAIKLTFAKRREDYIDNLSFFTDVKYFFQIIGTVVGGKNVYREEVGGKKEE